jgi:hypothetical protein
VWAVEAIKSGTVKVNYPHLEIETLEGVMKADINDFIIQGVNGEIYPCKPDIFRKTYDDVNVNSSGMNLKVDLLSLENVLEAAKIANNAIYFNDNSDYRSALFDICKTLCADLKDSYIGKNYIE